MPIIIDQGSSKEFIPCPAGTHQAVCVDVVDLGEQPTQYGPKRKVKIVWQVNELMDDGSRFSVQNRYTASLNEKAILRKDLESWRGRPFTEEELKGFDIEKLLGANCLLSVIHAESGDKTYANVKSISPLMKGMQKIAPEGYTRIQDRPQNGKPNGAINSHPENEREPGSDDADGFNLPEEF